MTQTLPPLQCYLPASTNRSASPFSPMENTSNVANAASAELGLGDSVGVPLRQGAHTISSGQPQPEALSIVTEQMLRVMTVEITQ